jgi:hypothetical protein
VARLDGPNHVDLERKIDAVYWPRSQAYSHEHRTLLRILSWRLLALPTARTRNLFYPIRRGRRRRESRNECLQQVRREDSFLVLVLRRIMCVVGVLMEAEAATAVGPLNGQRVISSGKKGREGKGKNISRRA